MNEFEKANRRFWDDSATIHFQDRTGFYRLEALRSGANLLTEIESMHLANIRGQRVLHLQCHIGTDTLSMARLGAIVTGLDFSTVAVASARSLAVELGLPVTFVEGNVMDTRKLVAGVFDIVFASWGALLWIADIAGWMRVAHSMLAPGGRLIIVEGHPSFRLTHEEGGRLYISAKWRWAADAPDHGEEETTYTGDPTLLEDKLNYSWEHPISDIVMGAIDAGFVLRELREHEQIAWQAFPAMVRGAPGLYRLPDGMPAYPLSFSLVAEKPASMQV